MGTMHLYRNPNDYQFIDRSIKEMFSIGAARLHIYKYLGPKASNSEDLTVNSDPNADETVIGDLLFGSNNYRKYSTSVYELYGHTQLAENTFNLMQFGIALSGNDTLYTTFHYNDMIKLLGRKLMSGDVIEMTFLKDFDLLDETAGPYSRFYVVQDAERPSEGYSMTWLSHLWRVRSTLITDSPEFKDIFDNIETNTPSMYDKNIQIMDVLLAQAEAEVPFFGLDTNHLYVDPELVDKIAENHVCNRIDSGDLLGNDGIPPNMNYEDVARGEIFPPTPSEMDYFIRTDSTPEKLFMYYKGAWRLMEYDNRQSWTDTPLYLNEVINTEETFIDDNGDTQDVRQGMSSIVKPKVSFKQ